MSKIAVLVRTRDEAHRIGLFCQSYTWAEHILIADGGSEDDTLAIASAFPNVSIRHFTQRTQMAHGLWRNNDSRHINFLIDWAYETGVDWVIQDDCDIRPNRLLREAARGILETTDAEVVMAVRLYLWGMTEHFPHMAMPGSAHNAWEASLWAWRPEIKLRTVDLPPAFTLEVRGAAVADLHHDVKVLDLMPPYCLLHYSWDDPERAQRKVDFYRLTGLIPGMLHPLEFAGPLAPLPEWAYDEL